MGEQSRSDRLAALMIALLLIATAWGNAVALLLLALLGLVGGAIFLRKSIGPSEALVATASFALAIVIALLLLLER
ncbi:MAG: hypothetical protein IPO81_06020 [Kouleothrix sp.]|nr:hypothetical protein [Kouleothrix sp.]